MNDTATLAQQMVVAAPAATRNVTLSTGPKRMAVIKVWDAMMRGARKYVEAEGFIKNHDVKLHSGAGVGMARVDQFILGQTDIRECVPFLINRDNVI